MMPNITLAVLAAIGLYACLRIACFQSVIVFDYQKAMLYKKGALTKMLGTGKHYYFKNNAVIKVVDIRKSLINLAGQEILTKDNVSVKITLAGFYNVSDPLKAIQSSVDYTAELYSVAQLALRNLVASVTIDQLLEKKGEIDAQLLADIAEKASAFGLTVSMLAVKDIMLPTNLKKAFSGILEAQKEAQRQLEKARGEQAVLRNLANSSTMYDSNPMLLQARLIQSLSTGNNSIVFNADSKTITAERK